jgi:hypothetical protein
MSQARPGWMVRGRGIEAQDLAVLFEFPQGHGAARKTAAQAGMGQKVARVLRPAMGGEIGGGGGGDDPLAAGADGHGDHVLFQPFLVTDARVGARGEDVDEAVLDRDLHGDVGKSAQEGHGDGGQDGARDMGGHVQPQGARRRVAKRVDHVQRGMNLGQRGGQAFEQTGAGLGGGDAARGAVEQADAEPGFEAADGFA